MSNVLLVLGALIGFVILVFAAAVLAALWLGEPPTTSSRRARRPNGK